MNPIVKKIEVFINQHLDLLKAVPETVMSDKPSPGKWSKKEILGHLVDSAQNNIRRFIVAQYEEEPKIVYTQDSWVTAADYQHFHTADIIQLWYQLNKQLCRIINNISEEKMQRKCQTEALHDLKWLAEDYLLHLRHHLHQVLDLELVVYS